MKALLDGHVANLFNWLNSKSPSPLFLFLSHSQSTNPINTAITNLPSFWRHKILNKKVNGMLIQIIILLLLLRGCKNVTSNQFPDHCDLISDLLLFSGCFQICSGNCSNKSNK